MLGALIPCGGGPPIALLKPKLLVGRHNRTDIPLAYPNVSSQHCELELMNGFWFVRDLASRNGIQVNGVACASERLAPHDILSIAGHRYKIEYTPPEDEAAAPRGMDRFGGSLLEKAGLVPREAAPVRGPARGATRGSPLGELVPCGGGNPVPLPLPRLLVGRDPACDIVLRFPTVSSRHCELKFEQGHWAVRDLGSSNGIRVDGVRCETMRVMPQSVLSIANHRYTINYTVAADSPVQTVMDAPSAGGFLEKIGLRPRKSTGTARAPEPFEKNDLFDNLPEEKDDEDRPKRWSLDDDE